MENPDAVSLGIAGFRTRYPGATRNIEGVYNWAWAQATPITGKVHDFWVKYSPAIPTQEDFGHCFRLGWKFEKEHFAYPPLRAEQSNEAAQAAQIVIGSGWDLVKNALSRGSSKRSIPETAMALLRELCTKLDVHESPMNGVYQQLKGQAAILNSPLPTDTQNRVVSSKWLFAGVHLGRETYRRREHLYNNLAYVIRWAVLWYAMGKLHSWARNMGFAAGATFAIPGHVNLFSSEERSKSLKDKFSYFDMGVTGARKVVNRNVGTLHIITFATVALAIWHKLRLPELSPLATSCGVAVMGATAGNYVGSPIPGSCHPSGKPKEVQAVEIE